VLLFVDPRVFLSGAATSASSAEGRALSACAALVESQRRRDASQQAMGAGGSGAVNETLTTVAAIVSNILQYPQEMKYRRLKRSNKRLKRTVLADADAVALLFALGFNLVGPSGPLPPSTDHGSDEGELELASDADLTILTQVHALLQSP
jgi:hypothetical protein